MTKEVLHNHHIIPKHMGGTDDDWNLLKGITVKQHAIEHLKLFYLHGKEEDLMAYQFLMFGQGSANVSKKLLSEWGKKGYETSKRNGTLHTWTKEDSKKGIQKLKEIYPEGVWKGRKHNQESKDKIGKTNSIKQKGKKNSQYGTMWITNENDSKKISANDTIPYGWKKGRVIQK